MLSELINKLAHCSPCMGADRKLIHEDDALR
jgi:hypothetical protein